MDSNEVIGLLSEIRDIQRQQLDEYRRVTAESLEIQRTAVIRQQEMSRFYKRAVGVAAVVVACLLFYLAYLAGASR